LVERRATAVLLVGMLVLIGLALWATGHLIIR